MTKHCRPPATHTLPTPPPTGPCAGFQRSTNVTSSRKALLLPHALARRPPLPSPLRPSHAGNRAKRAIPPSGTGTLQPSGNMFEGSRSGAPVGNPRTPHLMCLMWERMRRSWARRRCCCCRVRPALAIRWIKVSVILSKTRWIWSFSSRDFRVLDRNVYTPACAERERARDRG